MANPVPARFDPAEAALRAGYGPSQGDLTIAAVADAVRAKGYDLDPIEEQVHVSEERVLLCADRLVLKGRRKSDGHRVIIKAGGLGVGAMEIERERRSRLALAEINRVLGRRLFSFPRELAYQNSGTIAISVIEYLKRTARFLELPLAQRFALSNAALQDQQGVLASSLPSTTVSAFVVSERDWYLRELRRRFLAVQTWRGDNRSLSELLVEAERFFVDRGADVGAHLGRFAHADFVPNNFRVVGDRIHYLDLGSFRFGNQHHSWARFLNWLMVFDPALEERLVQKASEMGESSARSLVAMRAFGMSYLLQMYARSLASLRDDSRLGALQQARFDFWVAALEALVSGQQVSRRRRSAFLSFQMLARTDIEKQRQREAVA